MERYCLKYSDGRSDIYDVDDKLHFYRLLGEIDVHFEKVYRWDFIRCEWKEEK